MPGTMLLKFWVVLLVLTFCFVFTFASTEETYYITPTTTAPSCPTVEGIPCLTLSEYAAGLYNLSSDSTPGNVTLILQQGNHSLDAEMWIANISSLTILRNSTIESNGVLITCSMSSKFTFESIDRVHVSGIEFVDCIGNTITSVDEITLEDCGLKGHSSLQVKWATSVTILRSYFMFSSTLPPNSNITGAFAINGENVLIKNSVFCEMNVANVSAVQFLNSTVTLTDNAFVNNIADRGVVVLVENCNATVQNCTFLNNTVHNENSGVLHSRKSTITINNSSFIENTNTENRGGALHSRGSTITVNGSGFLNNFAGVHGGAVYIYGSTLTVNNSNFINNNAVYYGGAIFVFLGSVALNKNTFVSNMAGVDSEFANNEYAYGGAVYLENGNFTANDTNYANNTAQFGGAVYAYTSTSVLVYNTTFLSNVAGATGGALYTSLCGLTVIHNSEISNNIAYRGGSVCVESGHFNTTDTKYDNNTAQFGGAINVYHSRNMLVENVTFVDNKAMILAASGCVTTRTNVLLTDVACHSHGGAMLITYYSIVSIAYSKFIGNSASSAYSEFEDSTVGQIELSLFQTGGAIAASTISVIAIENSTFYNNSAHANIGKSSFRVNESGIRSDSYGGAIQVADSILSTRNTEYFWNSASSTFGYMTNSSLRSTENELYATTSLYTAGGALHTVGNDWIANTEIENCTFFENRANSLGVVADNKTFYSGINSRGGAVFVRQGLLTIMSTNFSGNSANARHEMTSTPLDNVPSNYVHGAVISSKGGTLHTISSPSVEIVDSTFVKNSACSVSTVGENSAIVNNVSSSGGGMHAESIIVTVETSTFTSNTAIVGFTYTQNVTNTADTLQNQTFDNLVIYNRPSSNSESASSGGAIHVFPESNVTITDCEFVNNLAMTGGAVTTFSSSAGPEQDGIDISNEFIMIKNSTYRNNTATATMGGGLNILNAIVTIENSSFFNNKAGSSLLHLINNTLALDNGNVRILDHATGIGGAVAIQNSTTCEMSGCVFENNTDTAVNWAYSNGTISNTMFDGNTGDHGGIASIKFSTITIVDSTLTNNKCTPEFGITGSLSSLNSTLTISSSAIVNNSCHRRSAIPSSNGALLVLHSTLTLERSLFVNNSADEANGIGGAASASFSTVVIDECVFINCTANNGGAFVSRQGNVSLANSMFYNNGNEGLEDGTGAVDISDGTITLSNCTFVNNGGYSIPAINLHSVSLTSHGNLDMRNNSESHIIAFMVIENSTVLLNGNTAISNNNGPLLISSSNVTFAGYTSIVDNNLGPDFGGVLIAFQSQIIFVEKTNIERNIVPYGTAVSATESTIYAYGETSISYNTGLYGGIYLFQSEINTLGNTTIRGNTALEKGGGIYAISSSVRLMSGSLQFKENHAKHGGAMYLKTNSKIYVLKPNTECRNKSYLVYCFDSSQCNCNDEEETWLELEFTENHADFGGALYIADDTNSDICAANTSRISDCFFQALTQTKNYNTIPVVQLYTLNTYFVNNSASTSGPSIFGGLLDRCHISRFVELYSYYNSPISALSYLTDYNVTNLKKDDIQSEISSLPVRVCFCRSGNQPDCSYQPPTVYIRKGETFNVSVVAVDQVNNTIPNATIHTAVSSSAGLSEGQAIQETGEACTELEYNVVSPHSSEQLLLYAEGPCKDTGISLTSVNVQFTPCPIGFVMSESTCDCDPVLYPEYVINCTIDSESMLRRDDAWISYVNTTDQQTLLTHPHCPFDYCYPPNKDILVNLNVPKGEDAQCAFNRSGKLCGSCEEGLSLSLGSSRCKSCSNYWLLLIVPFALAGIALVAFILVCDLTVAIGTMNGLIFYANIIATNQAILMPVEKPNLLTVFIAWLNLDLGIETCFFDGMDGYSKVWLQLAFPLYIILLVVIVIIICEHSARFSRLLSSKILGPRKNPITTLSTLILLSYTKLLTTIIATFSFATLEYQDGTSETVWLVDANVRYLEWKHIPLFLVAIVILILGLVYTLLLFFWQWLMRFAHIRVFSWVRNSRLNSFIEAYHGPYVSKHRYWTGLLLLGRALLYLISALNVYGDPSVNLLSIVCVSVSLLVLSNLAGKIYKKWLINAMEISILFNITILAAGASYLRESGGHQFQPTLAYTSIAIAFITFVQVLCYHLCTFVLIKPLEKLKHTFLQRRKRSDNPDCEKNDKGAVFADENFNGPTYTEVNGLPTIGDNDTTSFCSVTQEYTKTENNRESDDDSTSDNDTGINVSSPYKSSSADGPLCSSISSDQFATKVSDDNVSTSGEQAVELKCLD